MQFFYALFFFLFSTFVIAAPVPGGGDTSSVIEERRYYVLKKPGNLKNPLSGMVLETDIARESFFLLELNEKFDVVSRNAVNPEEKHSLAGTWHSIPTMITATPYRLMTLSISPVHNDPHKVECNINFAEKKPLNLHEPETYDSSHISGSYWVLGNLKKGEPADEWYNILHIKNGQYATFKLNNEFSIIDNSEREVSAPSPGDYYNIPFGKEDTPYRFKVLRLSGKPGGSGTSVEVKEISPPRFAQRG